MYEKTNVIDKISDNKDVRNYCDEYINFLNKAKTEFESVTEIKKMLDESGFVDISSVKKLKEKDKVYYINKDACIYAAIIGNEKLEKGVNILGAHIDSPRLDLKPMPLYDNQGMCLFKTQYYGGIKKYQWLTIPLAMHAVIYNSNNERLEIVIGEDENDPCFTITDILPHLGRDQMKKTAGEFIDPEKMSILCGSIKDEKNVKSNILKILNTKYNIEEIDFLKSDIRFVPAFKARYVGFDRGIIGGYGQDDRICSYAVTKALINSNTYNKTAIALLVDKEEIGSNGTTSMQSETFDMFVNKLIKLKGEDVDKLEVYSKSKMLSADVSSCIDPLFEDVFDIQNCNKLGYGISLEKYTGKNSGSEATARYMAEVMDIFKKEGVIYQSGTLGKIGKGGGGTIAYILANKGIDVIDCGTAVLCMHSPFELAAIGDTYMTYKAYAAFLKH